MDRSAILIGLMSGTSLDGISAAVVRFSATKGAPIACELLHFHARDYSRQERDSILRVINAGDNDSICRLNFVLGELFAAAALQALQASGVNHGDIAAIASHGQTIWHVPGVATLQIGESAVIAERTGCAVVSDFRVRDVAAGGQGAPLVPIADSLLFASGTQWRAIQNIGGIGNVSVIPPHGDGSAILAFDTGPGVVVIDGVVDLLTNGAERMDRDARYSGSGQAITGVVDELLTLPFFAERPPKSTGRELFNAAFIAEFVARCKASRSQATMADIVATAVSFTARSIALAYRDFIAATVREVLLCGGGARHPLLRAELTRELAPMQVRDFSEVYFDPEAKEAVAFALLGFLHMSSEFGNVPSATGARGPRILGKFTPA